ncbi:MAG TPA: AAA family ATPase, partial [Polyangiales bacterium]|nr:AAA family ATPase [Polyangiales bacterium]
MTTVFGFDEFELDAEKLVLTRAGEPVRIDTQTVRLLELFLRRPGELITKQDLIAAVWDGRAISDSALTVAIARLRNAISSTATPTKCLTTVHGRGYRFVRPVVTRESSSAIGVRADSKLSRLNLPFVGRERVLAQLYAALQDARAQHGQLLVLSGEAGIGKTRTAERLARDALLEQIPVAFGHCRETGDTPPLWPIVQLMRDLVEKLSLHDTVRARIPSLALLLPELSTERPGSVAESSQPVHKHLVFDGVARLLGVVSELTPCLLVLDDLHRADDATLELVRYLCDELGRSRTLLVATLRTHQAEEREQLAHILGHRNCTIVLLQRLSEADVQSYVETVLGRPDTDWSQTIFEKSEGNPFLMTQLAWSMCQAMPKHPAALTVPPAARDIVRQRITHLDEATRATLREAATIGRAFSLALLLQVSSRSIIELTSSLDQAVASGLLAQREDSLSDFAFSHELLREVLYDELSKAQQRELHLKVAVALEARAAEGESIPPSDLAYHFRRAVPVGDPRKAVDYCIKAATAAAAVFAYADGARFFGYAREALELVDSPSPRL